MHARFLAPAGLFLFLLFVIAAPPAKTQETPLLPDGLSFRAGAVNAVSIGKVAVYHPVDRSALEAVLLTHARRDLVEAARPAASGGASLFAPEPAREFLEGAEERWNAWWDKRFNYYDQQVTQWPTASLPAGRYLADGETFEAGGVTFEALLTPGFTREGATYLAEIGGKRVAFTGNLIWEGGRVFDLYSFQEAIQDAKIGGYHGYAGRFGPWIESLRKVAAEKPDLIVPSRGPVIGDPAGDIDRAIARAQAIYANYISTNALHWYFGEERMRTALEKVLGAGATMESPPFCEHVDLPDWCRHIATTKLLISESGAAFSLDVGGQKQFDTLKQALADGLVKKIEGIWVTHLHNDHSQAVRDAQDAFDCPVYGVKEVADGLARPGDFFTPGLSANAVARVTAMKDGETMKWREYTFTARFFPGQMHDHGGLLVEREGHDPVFFIGDSFSPSGLDDYCLMNQNLMREDDGYLRCLRIVRKELPPNTWLVNQHIPHLFRFNERELDYLEDRYRQRIEMIADFVPWDDPNFAVDEQWAWLFPYGQEAKPGQSIELSLELANHSTSERAFEIVPHGGGAIAIGDDAKGLSVKLAARETKRIAIAARVDDDAKPGVRVVTISIGTGDFDLPHWCAAMVKVNAGSE
ncbi:MAG: MBL fold metallo-hydrolase [Akkermansiaceae bacterium]|nr:MBL fold metallo-hydrolase [Akkermansiaceae bacterium]MCP5550485.1 MBL fold metallo-hydrolase [Akkermansiaceae bacterium]